MAHRTLRIWLAACALPVASACSEPEHPSLVIPRETIERRIEAANARSWRAAYDLELADGEIVVRLSVALIPDTRVRRSQVEARETEWEAGAEATWSNRFALDVGERSLPIRLDLSFGEPPYHHKVVVRSFPPGIDQLNWSHRASAQVIAHEVGHMIGAFDEYPGGGTDPAAPVLDPTSIMAANPTSGVTHPRHYEPIRSWLATRIGREDIAFVSVAPES